jgi:hypothetical protein
MGERFLLDQRCRAACRRLQDPAGKLPDGHQTSSRIALRYLDSWSLESEEKTKGGIIIPDTAKEKPQEGEIVAVGPGNRDEAGKLVSRSTSRLATACCSANGPAPKSR